MTRRAADHGLEFLLAFDGRIHHLEKGYYNAHDVPARGSRFKHRDEAGDHWHRTEKDPGRPYVFKDAETLIDNFFDEVERVLHERGVGVRVTRAERSRRSK